MNKHLLPDKIFTVYMFLETKKKCDDVTHTIKNIKSNCNVLCDIYYRKPAANYYNVLDVL